MAVGHLSPPNKHNARVFSDCRVTQIFVFVVRLVPRTLFSSVIRLWLRFFSTFFSFLKHTNGYWSLKIEIIGKQTNLLSFLAKKRRIWIFFRLLYAMVWRNSYWVVHIYSQIVISRSWFYKVSKIQKNTEILKFLVSYFTFSIVYI